MKKQLRKWGLRLTTTVLLIAGLLLVILLNPILSYGNKTTHRQFSIYHDTPLDNQLMPLLDQADILLRKSEFYRADLKLDICLNDGSSYPQLVETISGRAFAHGFYTKVVIQSEINSAGNYASIGNYRWNLTQLLAHEMVHCLQFDKLGFWKSKPVAAIPNWKWEGYAEYISRQDPVYFDLRGLISRYQGADKNSWAISLPDNSISPREYVEAWMLVKYCLDSKKMSYAGLLADTLPEDLVRREMMDWYSRK
jgi:hypothetical protein